MMGDAVPKDKEALQNLFMLDWIRGKDSTGLAVVNKFNEEISIAKCVGDPFTLFKSYDLFDDDGLVIGNNKAYIGHNRAATLGKVSDENAHPFGFGEVVGAHNGTLRNLRPLEHSDKFEVDSAAIFYNLSQTKDVKEVVAMLDGAYALTWWDGYEGTMNFIRNHQRPLYWTRRVDRDVIYWASEKWMLDVALKYARINHTEPKEFEVNKHYTFDLEKMGSVRTTNFEDRGTMIGYTYKPAGNYNPFMAGSSTPSKPLSTNLKKDALQELKKYEGQTVEFWTGQKRKAVSGNSYIPGFLIGEKVEIRFYESNNPWFEKFKDSRTNFTAKIKKAVVLHFSNGDKEAYLLPDWRTIEEVNKDNIVPFKQEEDNSYLSGFNGRYLIEEEWKRATRNGCCYCSSGADENLHASYTWLNHTEYLCEDCSTDESAKNMAATIYGYGF